MGAIESVLHAEGPLTKIPVPIAENRISQRVASIDWMRGLVMPAVAARYSLGEGSAPALGLEVSVALASGKAEGRLVAKLI